MVDELFVDLIDELDLSTQVMTNQRLVKIIEKYNRYAAVHGGVDLIRYSNTGSELKEKINALPAKERIKILACYANVTEISATERAIQSEHAIKHKLINVAALIIIILIVVYSVIWTYTSVTGKPMPENFVIGRVFDFLGEVMRLIFG